MGGGAPRGSPDQVPFSLQTDFLGNCMRGVLFCFLTVASFPEPTEQGFCCSKVKAEWDGERSLPFVTRPSRMASLWTAHPNSCRPGIP